MMLIFCILNYQITNIYDNIMKQIRTLLVASLLFSLMLNTHAQKDRTLSNGFSIQFILGIPSPEYGVDKDASVGKEYQFSTLFGLQLGNRWYFTKLGPIWYWPDGKLV